MRKYTKALFLFGAGVATGVAVHKHKKKIKEEVDKLVKQGKIKSSEGKAILSDLTKIAKAKAEQKKKEIGKKVNKNMSNLKKKLQSKKKPVKPKKISKKTCKKK